MLRWNRLGLPCPPVGRLLWAITLSCVFAAPSRAQPTPFNPYADSQDSLPPVAADGTLHWGPFYKSAAIQKSYERLWSLEACRGTNKKITTPVERNTMVIDNLPEESLSGRVRATTGPLIRCGASTLSRLRTISFPILFVWANSTPLSGPLRRFAVECFC